MFVSKQALLFCNVSIFVLKFINVLYKLYNMTLCDTYCHLSINKYLNVRNTFEKCHMFDSKVERFNNANQMYLWTI